ncbi:MAG: 2'-5' RNA ligase family protein [Candidatus Saccharibacteria bacterium]
MALIVIAYPKLINSDFEWIQKYRQKNDELYYSVIKPHFTLVFPVFDYSDEKSIINHIVKELRNTKTIKFNVNHVEINKDAFNEYWHTFLVPDIGSKNIVNLHDKLYSGVLKKELRTDIPFTPHIGIGNSKNMKLIKKEASRLNSNQINITGLIDCVDICRYEDNDTITTIKKIKLQKK